MEEIFSYKMIKKQLINIYKKGCGFLIQKNIRFKILQKLNKMLVKCLKSDFVQIDGDKIYLDQNDSSRLSIWCNKDAFLREIFKKEIKKGDVVIDIGAHIGYHTLIFAKIVGEKGKVFAFEPEPANFAMLKKNIKVNGYRNVVVEQKAVSNTNAKLRLYYGLDNSKNSIIQSENTKKNSVEVDCIRLDGYFKDAKINFIKMDIEGAELYALKGMQSLLKKNKHIKMVTEFSPHLLKEYREFIDLLKELKFKLQNINERDNLLEPFHVSKIPIYTSRKPVGVPITNLLCYK